MKPLIAFTRTGWTVEFAGKTTKCSNRSEAYALADSFRGAP